MISILVHHSREPKPWECFFAIWGNRCFLRCVPRVECSSRFSRRTLVLHQLWKHSHKSAVSKRQPKELKHSGNSPSPRLFNRKNKKKKKEKLTTNKQTSWGSWNTQTRHLRVALNLQNLSVNCQSVQVFKWKSFDQQSTVISLTSNFIYQRPRPLSGWTIVVVREKSYRDVRDKREERNARDTRSTTVWGKLSDFS